MNPTPPDWTWRAPRADELEAITGLLVAGDIADHGYADTTVEDVETEWNRPGFDLSRDARVYFATGDVLAAYVEVYRTEVETYISHNSGIHPAYRSQLSEMDLIYLAEALASPSPRLRTVSTTRQRNQTLEAAGYTPTRWDWRMEIELESRPSYPEWPAGFRLRPFDPEIDAQAVHQLVQVAFRDLPYHADMLFEAWKAFIMRRADFDPSLLLLVENDGEPAGCAICYAYADLGWVRQLAVRRDCRGRGLGLALLQQAFAVLYARGKRKIGLTVDSNNPTGAPQLYQRAGMHPAALNVTYQKTLD